MLNTIGKLFQLLIAHTELSKVAKYVYKFDISSIRTVPL